MYRHGLGREDHEHGGQVPVAEPKKGRQHGDRDLGAEEARAVQAAVEERVEQEPRERSGDSDAGVLEVESRQRPAGEIEHVVRRRDHDDGVPIPGSKFDI